MADVAAHVTDHVLPHLPVRQRVLSLPKRLRPFLHGSPEVASAVLAVFIRALGATLRSASPTAPGGSKIGAISFPQRFGGSLNPHYHFHILAVDGVFTEAPPAEVSAETDVPAEVEFHEVTWLGPEHWEELAQIEGDDRTGLQRLARLVPPPRVHRHRYHGVLASHAWLRSLVVELGKPKREEPELAQSSEGPNEVAPRPAPTPVPAGAGPVSPHVCPGPGSSPGSTRCFRSCAPPVAPARTPPQAELSFDPMPALPSLRSGESAGYEIACREDLGPHGFDPSDPEPVPEPDFDPLLTDHWDP